MSHEYHSSSVHLLLVAAGKEDWTETVLIVYVINLSVSFEMLYEVQNRMVLWHILWINLWCAEMKCDHKMLRIGITESVSQSVSGVYFVAFIITGDELELREVAKVSRLSGGSLSFISVHTWHDMESFIINDHMLRWWTESLSSWNTRLDRRQIKGSIAY